MTNQLQYLAYADHIYLVHDATVLKVTLESPELKEMLDHHKGNDQITSGVVCKEVSIFFCYLHTRLVSALTN